MKFYAVKKGRTPGIFRTWPEAKKQVEGFAGAEYKAFTQITDATDYLNWNAQTQGQVLQKDQANLQKAIKQVEQKATSLAEKKPNHKNDYFAVIYTDGGSRNTGVYQGGHVKASDKAAWAYQIKYDHQEIHDTGGQRGATNNKMEQTALINALQKLIELGFNQKRLLFVLDSKYVLSAINQHWLIGWKKRGWQRSGGKLSNRAEWQKIEQLLQSFPASTFKWTKGHAGNTGNEFVDHLLNRYMDEKE